MHRLNRVINLLLMKGKVQNPYIFSSLADFCIVTKFLQSGLFPRSPSSHGYNTIWGILFFHFVKLKDLDPILIVRGFPS